MPVFSQVKCVTVKIECDFTLPLAFYAFISRMQTCDSRHHDLQNPLEVMFMLIQIHKHSPNIFNVLEFHNKDHCAPMI